MRSSFGKRAIGLALALLVFHARELPAGTTARILLEDVVLRVEADRLELANDRLLLRFNRSDGAWTTLAHGNSSPNLLAASRLGESIDVRVDGASLVEREGAKLLRHDVEIDARRKGATLNLVVGLRPRADLPGDYEFELTSRFTLFPGQARVDRSCRLLRRGAGPDRDCKLEGFDFRIPGVGLGDPGSCRIDVPGPFDPGSFIAPTATLKTLEGKKFGFHGAPDTGFGILAVSNPTLPLTLACWMDTGGEVNASPGMEVLDHRASFRHFNARAYRMPHAFAVSSDIQRIELAEALPELLSDYRAMVVETMPPARQVPTWVRQAVILEAMPAYFREGFKGLTGRLSFYHQVGFNTIYLMPHWLGGYSPLDPFVVDPKLGTTEDLRDLVRTAHGLGMHVIFDMVIHGFNGRSSVPRERPEMFVKDEQGALSRHPTWKSITTDWAAPAYRKYMEELVVHDVKEYDVDGYRVDAASFKGPGWNLSLPYPAYRPGTAAPDLVGGMRQAMRRLKPEAALLSEVFGPLASSYCDMAHDNMTQGLQLILERMDAGGVTVDDYKIHMANVLDALPPGVPRVYFARNHDTSWFYHFNGYTPRLLALDAIHALFGIPEVFAGDPNHGPSPDDDPRTFEHYRRLFSLRSSDLIFTEGDVILRSVRSTHPMVFTGLRRRGKQFVLAAVSLSETPVETTVTLNVEGTGPGGMSVALADGLTGQSMGKTELQSTPAKLILNLRPFQVLIARW